MSLINTTQVQIEALLFLEDILQKGHQVATCEIFETAMRKGYGAMAERGDLDAMADAGCYLLDHDADEAFVAWLDEGRPFDVACRLFATAASQRGGNIALQAASCADFYTQHSMSRPGTSVPAQQHIRATYAAVMAEIPKFVPGFSAQKVLVPPLSSGLQ
jgi:hypothetical protein